MSAVCLLGSVALAGCGGTGVFPESTAIVPLNPDVAVGSIRGSDYGGHAPLVGAHIYLLQPGQAGYGSVTKGLLNAAYKAGSGYPTTQNSNDQFVPTVDSAGNPYYYETADSTGQFNITGDYACTVGQPVFLVGYGGSPSFVGAGPNTFAAPTEELYNDGTTGYWFTYTTSSPQLFYVGEPVVVSGNTSGSNGFNATGTILGVGKHYDGSAAALTTTSFSIYLAYGSAGLNIPNTTTPNFPPAAYGGPNVVATGTPAFNPAAVNIAMLGVCPASGNFSTGASALQYVYMNEISTTAFAYAMNGYANYTGSIPATATNGSTTLTGVTLPSNLNSYALYPGEPVSGLGLPAGTTITAVGTNTVTVSAAPVNVTSPTTGTFTILVTNQAGNHEFNIGAPNTTQAQQGIQNAAINAGNLYDIQHAAVSSTGDGEGHLARSATASGTGVVPQTLIDTIGNILAACVDSYNTYRLGTGTKSPQCQSLGYYASDNGVYDTSAYTHQAFNIAQAAFNLARYPQGMGTGTTTGANASLYGGTQAITAGTAASAAAFTAALTNLPTGNVPFAPYLAVAPNDFAVAIQWNIGVAANDVQIDKNGNAFAVAGVSGMYQITPSGTISAYTGSLSASNGKNLGSLAIDGVNGNIWATGATGVYKFTTGTPAGTLVGGANGTLGTGIAVDSLVNQYWGSGAAQGIGASIVKQNAAGVSAGGNFPILSGITANSAGICAQGIGFVALDKSGNMWTGTSDDIFNGNPYVCRFDALGNLKYSLAVPTGIAGQAGGFGYPHGLATDSSDNAFFPDKNSDRIYKVAQGSTVNNSGFTYLELHGQLSAPKGIAVDGANTLWISNPGDLPATTGAKYATGLVQFSNTPTLLTPNYITGAAYSAQPTTSLGSVAIDPSGNVWSVQSQIFGGATPTLVYEYIGLATPTVTPIATAKANGTVGVRP